MASIVKNDEQVQALEFIDASIAEVKLMNAMILEGTSGTFKLSCKLGRKNASLDIDRRLAKNAVSILREQRRARVKEINTKLQKFKMIQLSEEETAIISDSAITPELRNQADEADSAEDSNEMMETQPEDNGPPGGDDDGEPGDEPPSFDDVDEDQLYEDDLFSGKYS